MHDFGIIGMTEPQYDESRCINCQACLKACKKLSVGALSSENYKIVRNTEKCIGCGVCVENVLQEHSQEVRKNIINLL